MEAPCIDRYSFVVASLRTRTRTTGSTIIAYLQPESITGDVIVFRAMSKYIVRSRQPVSKARSLGASSVALLPVLMMKITISTYLMVWS